MTGGVEPAPQAVVGTTNHTSRAVATGAALSAEQHVQHVAADRQSLTAFLLQPGHHQRAGVSVAARAPVDQSLVRGGGGIPDGVELGRVQRGGGHRRAGSRLRRYRRRHRVRRPTGRRQIDAADRGDHRRYRGQHSRQRCPETQEPAGRNRLVRAGRRGVGPDVSSGKSPVVWGLTRCGCSCHPLGLLCGQTARTVLGTPDPYPFIAMCVPVGRNHSATGRSTVSPGDST